MPRKKPITITGGQTLVNTHFKKDCAGTFCSIHRPSNHHMRDWPLNWRSDRGLMERICPCGIGHPDPDHMDWYRRENGEDKAYYEGIHGCCGHCNVELWKAKINA